MNEGNVAITGRFGGQKSRDLPACLWQARQPRSASSAWRAHEPWGRGLGFWDLRVNATTRLQAPERTSCVGRMSDVTRASARL